MGRLNREMAAAGSLPSCRVCRPGNRKLALSPAFILPSSYYPSVYYMPGTANRYVMNNYSSGNIPNVLSYGSIPGNLSGSYNSLTNYISRYNKANLSYTSMDYYDGAADCFYYQFEHIFSPRGNYPVQTGM